MFFYYCPFVWSYHLMWNGITKQNGLRKVDYWLSCNSPLMHQKGTIYQSGQTLLTSGASLKNSFFDKSYLWDVAIDLDCSLWIIAMDSLLTWTRLQLLQVLQSRIMVTPKMAMLTFELFFSLFLSLYLTQHTYFWWFINKKYRCWDGYQSQYPVFWNSHQIFTIQLALYEPTLERNKYCVTNQGLWSSPMMCLIFCWKKITHTQR